MMKIAFKLLLGATAMGFLFTPIVSLPVLAQSDEMFKDVPMNHWAYDDIRFLKAASFR